MIHCDEGLILETSASESFTIATVLLISFEVGVQSLKVAEGYVVGAFVGGPGGITPPPCPPLPGKFEIQMLGNAIFGVSSQYLWDLTINLSVQI